MCLECIDAGGLIPLSNRTSELIESYSQERAVQAQTSQQETQT